MKKTITLCGEEPARKTEYSLQTHRLKPRKKEESDNKSLSIGDRTGISTNELLSSISPKLNPRSISISSESRVSTVLFDREQVRVSCLDHLSIPKFSLSHDSGSLDFQELKRMAIRKKCKNIVSIPTCIHKVKKICGETNCLIKQKWKKNLILEQKDSLQAQKLRKIVSNNPTKYDKQIQKDVIRSFTCNMIPKTKITLYHIPSDKNNVIEMLKVVLKMLAHCDPDVGYMQGMNLYVGIVVSHMKEIESSFMFVREIMKYGNMRNMYTNGFQKLKELAEHLLHRHLKILMNDLYELLVEAGVTSEIFMPFYLSMYACVIDYPMMASVIDQFMCSGFLFLDKLMMSMLCYLKNDLLDTEVGEIACKLGSSYIRASINCWEDVINLAQSIELN